MLGRRCAQVGVKPKKLELTQEVYDFVDAVLEALDDQ